MRPDTCPSSRPVIDFSKHAVRLWHAVYAPQCAVAVAAAAFAASVFANDAALLGNTTSHVRSPASMAQSDATPDPAQQEKPAAGDPDQGVRREQQRPSERTGERTPERTGERTPERNGGRGGRMMPLPPDWPRAGGFGPGSEGRESPLLEGLVVGEMMAEGEFGKRELSEADLARVVAVARRVSDEWGRALETRLAENPAQARQFLRTGGRRLMALVALEVRAPKVFEAKVVELRAQGETARAAQALSRAETTGASDAELATLRETLDQAARAQFEATLATRAEELAAIEARVARLREELAEDRLKSATVAAEIRERAESAARERTSRSESAPPREAPAP